MDSPTNRKLKLEFAAVEDGVQTSKEVEVDEAPLGIVSMGHIRAGSDMAEMARLPLLPHPSPAQPQPRPGPGSGKFQTPFLQEFGKPGWAFSQPWIFS